MTLLLHLKDVCCVRVVPYADGVRVDDTEGVTRSLALTVGWTDDG
jgi:hypothetical protein